MTDPNGFLSAALRLAESGWAVLPLKPGRKEPIVEHGCHDATRDAAVLEAWWRRWPKANVGVATGEPSGIVVIDVDGPEGEASWAALVDGRDQVEALEQATGRPDGGRQLFFAHPGGRVQCRTGIRPGIDCRGDGGYVVVPPSVHPSGRRYHWTSKGRPDPLPTWLLDLLRPPKRERARRSAPVRACGSTTPWGRTRLDANVALVREASEGVRNATLNTAAFKVGQGVGSGEIDPEQARSELMAAALDCGLKESESRKTIESGLTRGQEQPVGPTNGASRPPRDEAPPPEPGELVEPLDEIEVEEWRGELLLGKRGAIRPVLPNAVVLLRHHPALTGRLVWDARYLRAEWGTTPPWTQDSGPRALAESDSVEASRWLAAVEGVAFGSDVIWTAMVAEAQRQPIDRVRGYLDGLAWDERPRIDSWLVDLLHVEPGDAPAADWRDYVSAVGAAWLISAVARAYRPGCQADHMLVLEGEQGTLKSSSLAALGGPHYCELTLDVSSKDAMGDIHGPWIVEWSELAGLGRREAEAVKSFLSRRVDRFRPPYGRVAGDYPRGCVFAGTTNESLSLSDATGNRRYWPVRVGRARPDEVEGARDQLWAEAVFRYNCGERWWLDPGLELIARDQQQARLESDAWEEAIAEVLAHGNLQQRDFVTTADLFAALQIPASQQHTGGSRRLSRIMDALGWRADRGPSDVGRRRGYYRPGVVLQLHSEVDR